MNRVTSALQDPDDEPIDAPPVPWMHGAAGICGGAVSMTVFYPLDIIRTRMHTYTGNTPGESRLRGVVASIRADGLKSMFRGVKIAVISHSLGWGTYLTIFRSAQQSIAKSNGGDSSLGDFVAACGAAGVTSAIVTPLNFLKTNVQLAKASKDDAKVTARGILEKTLREQGAWALMRGLGPQFLLSSHTTIQVAMYECIKRALWPEQYKISKQNKDSHHSSGDASSSNKSSRRENQPPWYGVALASAVSKGFAAAICNPLEVARTRLQDRANAASLDYASMGAAFRTIWRNEGLAGLYRGVTVNVARVVPTTVVAFVIYEKLLHGLHFHSVQQAKAAAQEGRR